MYANDSGGGKLVYQHRCCKKRNCLNWWCQTLASQQQWLAPLQDGNEELYKTNSIGNMNFVVDSREPTPNKK